MYAFFETMFLDLCILLFVAAQHFVLNLKLGNVLIIIIKMILTCFCPAGSRDKF